MVPRSHRYVYSMQKTRAPDIWFLLEIYAILKYMFLRGYTFILIRGILCAEQRVTFPKSSAQRAEWSQVPN